MTAAGDETFRRALEAFQAGKVNDAERLFKELLSAQPKHVAGLNLIGILLTHLGRFEEAEHFVRRALNENVKSDATYYNYGIILKALGRPTEALERFSQALAINAAVAETWNNRGTVFNDLKRHKEAIADFDKAISLNSNYPDAFCNKGKSLAELKMYDQSLGAYDRALTLKPTLAEAWFGRGNIFADLKRYNDALAAYDKALISKTDFAGAWLGRGHIFSELKQYNDALASYERALAIQPGLAEAWLGRGHIFSELKQYNDAFASYDRALALKPDLAEAWVGRGNISTELKQYDEAFAAYDKALALKPDLSGAWVGRGNILTELNQYNDAFAAYDKALASNPDIAGAWLGRGNIFTKLNQYHDALAAYDRALALKGELAEAWAGRGNIFNELNQNNDALAAYDRALAIKPDLAGAWVGRGNIFTKHNQYDDAFAAYDRALASKPDLAEAWVGRGNIHTDLKRYAEALAAYDKALAIEPKLKYAEGIRLHMKMHLCDWSHFDAESARVIDGIKAQAHVAQPFEILALTSSPSEQLQCARLYAADRFPSSARPVEHRERRAQNRIRVAYLSADLHEHPVSYLMAEIFERHDRAQYETIAISFGPESPGEMQTRLRKSFERFVDVRSKSDSAVVSLLGELEIDIAIDLMGYTKNARPGILASHPVPIQVNYLGFPATAGASFIDYILADRFVIPEDKRQHYSEKVVYLPETFQANSQRQNAARRIPSRAEAGLPEHGFVFCSFNNTYKLTPVLFDIWMRLLREVDSSVLWLLAPNAVTENNLRREAADRGIDSNRIIFAQRVEYLDYLSRYQLADLFLDTLPFNGGTTASDALWAGLPLVTCSGDAFASRMAGSLLKAAGLSELVTYSLEEYESLALKLARDPIYLAAVKTKLASGRDEWPLFNAERFTRHLETAYKIMWERHELKEPPENFAVEPIQ